MAKTILTAVLVVLLHVLAACDTVDSGRSQVLPGGTQGSLRSVRVADVAKAGETDIVEEVTVNRRAYIRGLESLIAYYGKTGNSMKAAWAEKELAALQAIPQYQYITEAEAAGPELRATMSVVEADYMYREAAALEKEAKVLGVLKNEETLRLALDRYRTLISRHPSSDKIDDAAYRAAGIHEDFKDYSIAALYYRRTYQWDPETAYPARFKEGYILDKQFHDRAGALAVYREAVEAARSRGRHRNWTAYAERRIGELTKTVEGTAR
ncbi:MAG: tetratricopeptide repeat protein [Planctomycetota bacterium]|jgi:tetratricopeptide (TPR) repeat protein